MALTIESQKKAGLIECNLNEILFPVERVKQEEFKCNSDYAYDIFGYINGIKTRLNCCSERYELVENSEVFAKVEETLRGHNINFEVTYYHLHHARFYADYKILNQAYTVANGDIIYPNLRVQHSYNGLTKYGIKFGYFRQVCTNGLTVPVKEKEQFNFAIGGKHTTIIKRSLEILSEKLQFFINEGEKTLDVFREMTKRSTLNVEDRITEVMKFAKINIVNNKNVNTMQYITEVIADEARNYYGGIANDWLVYNGINRYINDNNVNIKSPEVRAELDAKVIGFMIEG